MIVPSGLSGGTVYSAQVKADGSADPNEVRAAITHSLRLRVCAHTAIFYVQMRVSHHDITNSGLYVLLMAVCDPEASPVAVDGSVDSLDPCECPCAARSAYPLHTNHLYPLFFPCWADGYVPADLFGDLPFYLALSCMYLIVGAAWLLLCFCFR